MDTFAQKLNSVQHDPTQSLLQHPPGSFWHRMTLELLADRNSASERALAKVNDTKDDDDDPYGDGDQSDVAGKAAEELQEEWGRAERVY